MRRLKIGYFTHPTVCGLRLCGLSYGQFRQLLKTFLFGGVQATAQCELFLTAPNRNILTYLFNRPLCEDICELMHNLYIVDNCRHDADSEVLSSRQHAYENFHKFRFQTVWDITSWYIVFVSVNPSTADLV